jgi:Uma2 family endonuclease
MISTAMTEAPRRATYEDVIAAPENMVAELIDGVLYTQARPATPHARASTRLGADLSTPFDRGKGGPGGWILLDEPELHFGEDVLVPDIAGWRRERLSETPDAAAIKIPPNWLCETLSPSTQAHDRVRKMAVYAREGVRWVWLVDPLAKTIEVFELQGGKWTVQGTHFGDGNVRLEPFDAVELETSGLWRW